MCAEMTSETTDRGHEPGWAALFRVGAIAAILTAAITVLQVAVFVVSPPPSFQPTPAAAVGIFDMMRANPVLGFVKLDGLMLVDYVLIMVVFVTLYVALRRTQPTLMVLGTVFALVALTMYFSANPALAMLALSRTYAAATDPDRAATVAAGQAVLANFQGSGFIVHYLLMGVAGILVSVAMLRSTVFSRTTAVAGILQGAMMLVPSSMGTIGLVFALGSLVPFVVWFVLIAVQLLRLA